MINLRTCFSLVLPLAACGPDVIYQPAKDSGASEPVSDDTESGTTGEGEAGGGGTTDAGDEGSDTSESDESLIDYTHPRLFFSSSDIPVLQARIYEPERADFVNAWDTAVGAWRTATYLPFENPFEIPTASNEWTDIADPLPNLSMYSLFTSNAEFTARTAQWVAQITDQENWGAAEVINTGRGASNTLHAICIAYDMLYDQFDDTQRIEVRRKIIEQAGELYSELTGPTPPKWAEQWNSREAHAAHTALLVAGLSVERDYDQADLWTARAKRFVQNTLVALEDVPDGTWPSGPSLGSDTLTRLYESMFLLDRHYGISWITHPWLLNRSQAMTRESLPGRGVVSFADGTSAWIRDPAHQACFTDQFADVSTAGWFSLNRGTDALATSRTHNMWLEFLWCDPSASDWLTPPPITPSHWFEDWNVAVWTNGSSTTSSSFALSGGPPSIVGDGVDDTTLSIDALHPAAGSFVWHPRGQTVITSGGTQTPKRTGMANSYTFRATSAYNRGWADDHWDAWWFPPAFRAEVGDPDRVGQRGEWGFVFGPSSELVEAESGIQFVETQSDITVMIADIAGAYPDEFPIEIGTQAFNLDRFTRSIVLLPRDVVLIFDHLEHSTSMTHSVRFHSTQAEFSTLGSTANITTPDGTTWSVDHAAGLSWSSRSHIQQIDNPDSGWVHHIDSSRLYGAGTHDHLYVLRTASQSVSTDVTEAEQGITVQVNVRTDGLEESYAIRLATSDDPALREAFLTFPGRASVQIDDGDEIRF